MRKDSSAHGHVLEGEALVCSAHTMAISPTLPCLAGVWRSQFRKSTSFVGERGIHHPLALENPQFLSAHLERGNDGDSIGGGGETERYIAPSYRRLLG